MFLTMSTIMIIDLLLEIRIYSMINQAKKKEYIAWTRLVCLPQIIF